MVIQCEKCNSKYRLDDSRIKPPGSSVRCSKCGHIFFVAIEDDFTTEKELVISEETPLFEDLKEEITTENEETTKTPEELTQGELNMDNENSAVEDDLLDLPTEHEDTLEEFIDNAPSVETSDNQPEQAAEKIDATEKETEIYDKEALLDEDNISSSHQAELLEVKSDTEEDFVETYDDKNLLEDTPEIDDEKADLIKPDINQGSFESSTINLQNSGSGIFSKIIYTLITIAAVFVIFISSIVLLINAEILPKGTLSSITEIVPIELSNSEETKIIISDHKSRWMNTVNGPIYIVSGLITNESVVPVNFVKLRSEYIAAEEKQYEDIFYAGNTFTDKELKDTPIKDILLRLDQKNGDIDVNNSRKLAGLNYNIRPGESIPFFSVFPAEGRMLGLKYNLEVIDFEEVSSK